MFGVALRDPDGTDQVPYDPAAIADASDTGQYAEYLRGCLRLLRERGTAPFGFAAGSKRPEHRMAMPQRGEPHTIAARLAADTGLKQTSWGIASLHAERDATMLLDLEGKQLPGMRKKVEGMLKFFRPQPLQHAVLRLGGEEVEDLPDPEDTDGVPPGLEGLPEDVELSPQGNAFADAAEAGFAFCEECAAQEAAVQEGAHDVTAETAA